MPIYFGDKLISNSNISTTDIANYKNFIENEVTLVALPTNVTSLRSYCFVENDYIKVIRLNDNLTSIGSRCFWKCSNLNLVSNIPSTLQTIESECFVDTKITEIDLSKCKDMFYLYSYCFQNTPLASIKLPPFLKSIYDGCFSGCSNLTNIVVPSTLQSIGNYCFSQTGLETINLCDCPNLNILPNSCFSNCSNLSNIGNLENPMIITSIGEYCFSYCYALPEKIDLTSWSKLTTIKKWAFFSCSSIQEIVLPSSITTLDSQAFYNCYNVKTITINKPQDSISGAPWGATNATVIWNG